MKNVSGGESSGSLAVSLPRRAQGVAYVSGQVTQAIIRPPNAELGVRGPLTLTLSVGSDYLMNTAKTRGYYLAALVVATLASSCLARGVIGVRIHEPEK